MNAFQPPGHGHHQLRIGDRERNEAAQLLGDHFAEGRLTREEYDERCTHALAARTAAELLPLFHDLPGPRPDALLPVPLFTAVPRPVRAKPRSRLPFLPVVLLLIGLAVLLQAPWVLLIGIGVWLLLRNVCGRSGHASGNRRPARGSWS